MNERDGDPIAAGSLQDGGGSVRVRIAGEWWTGTYAVAGRILIVRGPQGSKSACIGLLDHRKLAKALLSKLWGRDTGRGCHHPWRGGTLAAPAPPSAQRTPLGERETAEATGA